MKINESEKIQLEKILEELNKGATFNLLNGKSGFCLTDEMNGLLRRVIKEKLDAKKRGIKKQETDGETIQFTDEQIYRIYTKLFKEGGLHGRLRK